MRPSREIFMFAQRRAGYLIRPWFLQLTLWDGYHGYQRMWPARRQGAAAFSSRTRDRMPCAAASLKGPAARHHTISEETRKGRYRESRHVGKCLASPSTTC